MAEEGQFLRQAVGRNALLLALVSILSLIGSPSIAAETYSCRIAGDGTIGSDKAYGSALYGEDRFDRDFLSSMKSKVLIVENRQKIDFGGNEFERMKSPDNWHEVYSGGYWGIAHLYDYRKEGEVTLFIYNPNGYNSTKSNFVEIELWHCNK